jgi:hypothetical protein
LVNSLKESSICFTVVSASKCHINRKASLQQPDAPSSLNINATTEPGLRTPEARPMIKGEHVV